MMSNGMPTMKELFDGIVIDPEEIANRHLRYAPELKGHVLHVQALESVQPIADMGDEDEDDDLPDVDWEAMFSEEDGWEPAEKPEPCDEVCSQCERYECTGQQEPEPTEGIDIRVVVKVAPKGQRASRSAPVWKTITFRSPPLARYINDVCDFHDM